MSPSEMARRSGVFISGQCNFQGSGADPVRHVIAHIIEELVAKAGSQPYHKLGTTRIEIALASFNHPGKISAVCNPDSFSLTIERRNFPQFFITAPAPCPYLPGRFERKVFTHLIGNDARHLNSQLSHGGFRRSQNIAYRPACDGCASCVSVRVRTGEFQPSDSQRRVMKMNRDVRSEPVRAKATGEQYSLFRAYIDARHGEGGMADMTVLDFAAMVDENFVESRIVEYRLITADNLRGPLVAAVLVDVLEDGLSMIYSFYEPDFAWRSLGTFMILDHIARARRMGLPYLYLGYWVNGSRKMNYKSKYLPQERLTSDGWVLHKV